MAAPAETIGRQHGLIQETIQPLTERNQDRILNVLPCVVHAHAMIAGSRGELINLGYSEQQAVDMRLWPEAHQPIGSRLEMVRRWYDDLLGGRRVPVGDSDHAAHIIIEPAYDRSDEEKELQRSAFRGDNVHKTIATLSEAALTRAAIMQKLQDRPENNDLQILTGIEVDLLDPGVRLVENDVDNEIISGLADITPTACAKMNWVQLSYHPDEVEARSGLTVEQMTYDRYINMWIAAIKKNPTVDSISHFLRELKSDAINRFEGALDIVLADAFTPDNRNEKIDAIANEERQVDVVQLLALYDTVGEAKIAWEFNLSDARADKASRKREIAVTKKLLQAAYKFGNQYFSLGSDLHDLAKWGALSGELKQQERELYQATARPEQNLPPGDHFDNVEQAQAYDAAHHAIVEEALADPKTMVNILRPYAKHLAFMESLPFVNTAESIRTGTFDDFIDIRRASKQAYLAEHQA